MTEKSTRTVVQWPDTVVSKAGADNDLGLPLIQLLVDLGIKGDAAAEGSAESPVTAVTGTPVSVSIIEAGATAASKGWAALIAALGGTTAVWGAASDFWKSESTIQGTLVIAAAVVIAACALGIALIMYGDVRARGQGAAAQYSARASIATAFLRGAVATAKPEAATAKPEAVTAKPAATAGDPHAETTARDDLADIRAGFTAAQKQISGISETTQQVLKATGALSEDMQEAIVALALAQAGDLDVPIVLKTGGTGHAKRLIRSAQGEWRFQLDGQTWMPVSQIAAFGDEQIQPGAASKT
jgi:hypothetical protein